MSSGMARTSLRTVAQARSRSSSFPWAARVVDSARTPISNRFMQRVYQGLAPSWLGGGRSAGVQLQHRIEGREDRHRDAERGGAADERPLERLDLDAPAGLQIDEQ